MKIGITGSLSSGKSTASKILAKNKYPIFNADNEVAKLYKNTTFKIKIIKCLKIKEKTNLKKKIVDLIIGNKSNLKKVEKIIHPIIRKKMKIFAKKNQREKHVFFEIPLLIESKLFNFFDLIFLIGAKESIRFKRYKKKKGNYKIFKFLNNRQIKHKNKTNNSLSLLRSSHREESHFSWE